MKKIPGNADASLIAGGLLFIGSFACPCPFCYAGSATFLLNGVAGKLGMLVPKAQKEG